MTGPAVTRTQVYLEVGKKKTFAGALDWPGWVRAAKDADAALEALDAYIPRYAVVASLAGVHFEQAHEFNVVEQVPGTTTTDFGAPDVIASADHDPWSDLAECDRHIALLEASWRLLDDVAARASAVLRKGPRGGGRDRDQVVAHVVNAEASYARRIGVRVKAPDVDDYAAVAVLRQKITADLREPSGVPHAKPWPARYAARRIAWHVLDHAWEIEDKSLS